MAKQKNEEKSQETNPSDESSTSPEKDSEVAGKSNSLNHKKSSDIILQILSSGFGKENGIYLGMKDLKRSGHMPSNEELRKRGA